MYLPTSDIDLVVMDSRTADVKTALYAVSRKLNERKIARDVQVGPQADCLPSALTQPTHTRTIPLLGCKVLLLLLQRKLTSAGCVIGMLIVGLASYTNKFSAGQD